MYSHSANKSCQACKLESCCNETFSNRQPFIVVCKYLLSGLYSYGVSRLIIPRKLYNLLLIILNKYHVVSEKIWLKPGWVIRVKLVTFCADQQDQTRIIKISGSNQDLMLTVLLEYFDFGPRFASAELLPC